MKDCIIKLTEAKSSSDYEIAIKLFKEYASQIGIDLGFQNFNEEIENLESKYSRPKGVIYIAYNDENSPVGCFGIRAFDSTICELKRMYLKEEARGLGIGKLMMKKSITVAKELGYDKMRLDTLSSMLPAVGLYEKSGFYEIEPYYFNPIEEAKYFEISLNE
jgi:ribosomal protein S18 acetylase RimI-like enzyme